ncbi:MAG: HipA domain-containing protein [Smithella sp.]|jgi:hypothetical protein
MIPKLDSSNKYIYMSLQFVDANDGVSISEDLGIEPMGSKKKFWLILQDSEEQQPWLFKYARENTGEHWAEKIASELASRIHIPAARTELAEIGGKAGILVESFIPCEWDARLKNSVRLGELIHGNEVLAGCLDNYDKHKQWGHKEHSWQNIHLCLQRSLNNIDQAMEQFAGFLILDALIGNTDRHHENWGLISIFSSSNQMDSSDKISMAPSYDHASSLGRELTDQKRNFYLNSSRMEDYVRKAHGAIFHISQGKYGDNPLKLVQDLSKLHPIWFRPWMEQLHDVTEHDIEEILMKLPGEVISKTSIEFCRKFLIYTMNCLKDIPL